MRFQPLSGQTPHTRLTKLRLRALVFLSTSGAGSSPLRYPIGVCFRLSTATVGKSRIARCLISATEIMPEILVDPSWLCWRLNNEHVLFPWVTVFLALYHSGLAHVPIFQRGATRCSGKYMLPCFRLRPEEPEASRLSLIKVKRGVARRQSFHLFQRHLSGARTHRSNSPYKGCE